MDDQRNTIIAIVISLIILVGWQMFFSPKSAPHPPAATQAQGPNAPGSTPGAAAVSPPAVIPSPAGAETPERQAAVAEEKRVRIDTPRLHGSISLTGLRFDDVTLASYHESIDPKSPEVTLLSPPSAPKPYFIEQGWIAADPTVKLPTTATVWSVEAPDAQLTDTQPLAAHWDNGEGLRFTRTIRADRDFLFTVEQTVENKTDHPVTLFPYSLVARLDTPLKTSNYLVHEGPLGVFDRTLKEVTYKDLQKNERETAESIGGWVGITDLYWLTAVAFDQHDKVTATFNHSKTNDRDRYQSDLRGDAITIAPGETHASTEYVFAGAKEARLLDHYAESPGISRLDLAVDWGWFYFLTKPFFYALLWLKDLIGNFGLAILAFTVCVRLIMFPIANKQFASMNKMKALQPQMKALQERHANDKQKLNTELMELYKREKANPLAGCLPIIIQIPVFFALYKVLYTTIEMRHAPFYGWIHDLSAPDPTNVFTLFGLIAWTPPAVLHLGALALIYGFTMWLQQKLAPQPPDPVQARMMQTVLPVMFTFMMGGFQAGLVLYWAWSNTLGILQQYLLLKTHGTPAPATKKA